MCRICRNAEYVSCDDIDNYYDNSKCLLSGQIIIGSVVFHIGAAILLPLFICKYVTKCSGWGIFGLIVGGFYGGDVVALFLAILFSCLTYIIPNIPYAIGRCTPGLRDTANYAINKLANCCSRLARLVGLSGRDEQEIDVESSSTEELSKTTTSSSQKSELSEGVNDNSNESSSTAELTSENSKSSSASSAMSSESEASCDDSVETEQIRPQFSRRPSFASLINPFSIFHRPERQNQTEQSEGSSHNRQLSLASLMNSWNIFTGKPDLEIESVDQGDLVINTNSM